MRKCQVISCGYSPSIGLPSKAIATYESVGASFVFYACKECIDKFGEHTGISFQKVSSKRLENRKVNNAKAKT